VNFPKAVDANLINNKNQLIINIKIKNIMVPITSENYYKIEIDGHLNQNPNKIITNKNIIQFLDLED